MNENNNNNNNNNDNNNENNDNSMIDWNLLEKDLTGDTLAFLKSHLLNNNNNNNNDSDSDDINEKNEVKISIPTNNQEYSKKEYWDTRFNNEDEYDWLVKYDDIKNILQNILINNNKNNYDINILIIGCGNSTLSANLYEDGYHNITSTDYSPVVIESMRKKYQHLNNLKWEVMDMLNLTYDNNLYDIIIDKAAMDAIMTNEIQVWEPSEEMIHSSDLMCQGISRILKNDGIFIQISFAQSHFRKRYLLGIYNNNNNNNYSIKYNWDLTQEEINLENGCFGFFCYICKKRNVVI